MLLKTDFIKSLSFLSLQETAQIHISNTYPYPIQFKVVPTNPDNYVFSISEGRLDPQEQIFIHVYIRPYDKISEFNFIDNKIFVFICENKRKPSTLRSEQTQPSNSINQAISQSQNAREQTQQFSTFSQSNKLHVTEYLVFVDCSSLKPVPPHLIKVLKTMVKIQRYSGQKIKPEQYSIIRQKMAEFGTVKQVWDFQQYLVARYAEPIQITPAAFMQKGFLFTTCYISTQSGRYEPSLKINTPLIETMMVVQNYVIYKEKPAISTSVNSKKKHSIQYALNIQSLTNKKQKKRFQFDEDFFIVFLPCSLCACVSGEQVSFITSLDAEPICIRFNYFMPRCLDMSSTDLFYTGKCKSGILKKDKTYIFVIRNFNLKKHTVLADCKFPIQVNGNKLKSITVIDSPVAVFVLAATQHLLLLTVAKEQRLVTVAKLQIRTCFVSPLPGQKSQNLLNFCCISEKNKLIKVNIDNCGVHFGSEIVEYKQQVTLFCLDMDGRLFLVDEDNNLLQYNLADSCVKRVVRKSRRGLDEIKQLGCTDSGHLVLYVQSEEGARVETLAILQMQE